MKVRIKRTTHNNKGELLEKGQVIDMHPDFANYLIGCSVAENYETSPKVEKQTKEFKPQLQTPEKLKLQTKAQLKEQAKELPGYQASLKKAELIELLCK